MAAFLNKNSFYRIHNLTPFLHQTKPSRESIFCGKVSDWWIKRAVIVLKNSLKRLQWLANIKG